MTKEIALHDLEEFKKLIPASAEVFDFAIQAIKSDKPSGKWIENNEQPHVEKVYHCSNCGNKAWGEYEKTTYCPNCGAKMVEEQGENTDGKH